MIAVDNLIHPSAELSVLCGLCSQDAALAVELSKRIDPLDFSSVTSQVIAEAAIRILNGYEPLDAMTLDAACRDVLSERRITSVSVPESMITNVLNGDTSRSMAYAVTVKRFAWLRKAKEFADWFGREVSDIGDPDELFAGAQERIQHLQPAQRASMFVYGWDTIKEHDTMLRDRIRQSAEGSLILYDWPWESWNRFVRPMRGGLVGVIAAPDGIGKCLGAGTKVLMFDGTLRKVEDVAVGDSLMGPDSKPRRVLSLSRGTGMMYWVRQSKGIDYRTNSEHILSLWERKEIWEKHRKVGSRKQYVEISVKDALAKWSPIHMSRYIQGFKVAVDWQEQSVPIPPYILGLWLGDGTQKSAAFQVTTADSEIVDCLYGYAESLKFSNEKREYQGRLNVNTKPFNQASTYTLGFDASGLPSKIMRQMSPVYALKRLGLKDEKHIPVVYLANSETNRLDLLAGLMDSDGYYFERGNVFEICMINHQLIMDIKLLADSLGFRTSVSHKLAQAQTGEPRDAWRLVIAGDVNRIPTKLQRKQARQRQINKDWKVTSIQIEPDKVDNYYGFQLDGDGLFLLEDMTVTHNSTMLENIAEHWAGKQANVVFCHLENDFDYTMNRRLARWSKVPIGAIEDGTLTEQQQWAIREAYQAMNLDTLHYLDAAGWTMPELIAELTIRHSEGVCSAVVLDYLNKIRPSREQARLFAGKPYERQADDMEMLKSWAVRHKVPVITAVQMNKDGQSGGRQTRGNIRGSGEISEKAQLVAVLTREILDADLVFDNVTLGEKGEYSPLMTVRIDKQNRGRTAEWQQFYVGKHFTVHDIVRAELDY